ncbi:MAG TPA: PA2169 family four-helix-bundle protein [Candidatus Sulfomarinibacteraceae bacterium]|nr:PA2169 family four-helix-bundle protein [Candidatus Sulfomarinibacteraceae bacterium]
MATQNRQAVATLNRLARLCIASEKGFNVAAENVKNRGLMVMFKTYAQERSQYASQLQAAVEALGGEPAHGGGPLAAVHRGWINIKAAMTIGQPATEAVVLSEVVRGESVALRTYADALQRTLPNDLHSDIAAQHERIQEVHGRVQELQGREGRQLVVRLFDDEESAGEAISDLADAGFDPQRIEKVPLNEIHTVYEGQHVANTTVESALAGALVGAAIGVLLGLVASVSAIVAPGTALFGLSVLEIFVWTIVFGAVAGLFFGALIGAIIGLGVSQEDEYRYASSVERGTILLMLRTDTARAVEASNIMKGVNARRWRLAT